jgi:hypothetical protein
MTTRACQQAVSRTIKCFAMTYRPYLAQLKRTPKSRMSFTLPTHDSSHKVKGTSNATHQQVCSSATHTQARESNTHSGDTQVHGEDSAVSTSLAIEAAVHEDLEDHESNSDSDSDFVSHADTSDTDGDTDEDTDEDDEHSCDEFDDAESSGSGEQKLTHHFSAAADT